MNDRIRLIAPNLSFRAFDHFIVRLAPKHHTVIPVAISCSMYMLIEYVAL